MFADIFATTWLSVYDTKRAACNSRQDPVGEMTTSKRYFVQTYGCQMNLRDSELVAAQLQAQGYTPAASWEDADLVFVNTCSVRDKAEHKVYSDLGRLRAWKRERAGTLVVGGCVAQQERERIVARAPHVDLVLGTHQVRELGRHLQALSQSQQPVVATAWKHDDPEDRLGRPDRVALGRPSAFVTIQEGCDNVCSFCVVPFTRGREVSRPLRAILDEVRMHVGRGAKEIVLLGQNVNAYGRKFAGMPSFAELLAAVHDVAGVERIRFTSPHPQDYDDDLIAAYATLPRLCPSAHLPLQAGSDRVLKAMRRGYDVARYLDIVARLRAARPGLHFSTDIIVGFPGETAADFAATMNVVETVRYAQIYAFVYSPRPYTASRKLDDPVAEADKRAWLQHLLARQRLIQAEDHAAFVGTEVEVLWTEVRDGVLKGRTLEGRVAHALGDASAVGVIETLMVTRATANAVYCARPGYEACDRGA